MDEVTRAVELTKARMLELNGAFLQVLCHAKDAARTYEELRARIERTGREWTLECEEIRKQVRMDDEMAKKDEEPSDLTDLCRKQIQDLRAMFTQQLRQILAVGVRVEEAVSSMEKFFDVWTGPTLQSMLRSTALFDRKIVEMKEKLKEVDEGDEWKRSR